MSAIPSLIIKYSQDLLKTVSPDITRLATSIGITNIGSPNVQLPDTCLPTDILRDMATIRDNVYNKINSVAQILEKLTPPINVLNTVVTTTSVTLATVSAIRISTQVAVSAIPPPASPPGFLVSSLSTLKDVEDFLKPKIIIAQGTITLISTALEFANKLIANIMKIMKLIDEYIQRCLNVPPPSVNNFVTDAIIRDEKQNQITNTTQGNSIYQGFILEIVEEPYSPTVNRRKAVAKNTNGIILLQTPLSFTTDTNTLINELKLIIDKNNLKAF